MDKKRVQNEAEVDAGAPQAVDADVAETAEGVLSVRGAEDGMGGGESAAALGTVDGKRVLDTVGKAALSAALATSLVAVLSEPPRTDLMVLPEPTPIVQQYSPYVDDIEPAEDEEDDETESRWKKILRLLRMLAVGLLIAATVLFGALKGCASCAATAVLPDEEEESEPAAL